MNSYLVCYGRVKKNGEFVTPLTICTQKNKLCSLQALGETKKSADIN